MQRIDKVQLIQSIVDSRIKTYIRNKNFLIVLGLVLAFGALLIPGIKSLPVIDRDEAHFVQATRQMLQSHNYGQIRFQQTTRYQKPPGINWLQAASVKIFSSPDKNIIWPYRLPSVICALLTLILTYYCGLQMFDRKTGLLAAVFLGSSLLFVVESHMAVIDGALLLSVVLMQFALWKLFINAKPDTTIDASEPKPEIPINDLQNTNEKFAKNIWFYTFWTALSCGFLLKGVTPLVAILTVAALCVFNRDLNWLRNLRMPLGILLFFITTAVWVGYVNYAENTNYLMQMFYRDLLPKLQGGHESHGKPALFHLAILLFTFWPASLFLPKVFKFVKQNIEQKTILFLICWIIPVWIFFEIMPTKLPQYVLPVFPALAILTAKASLSLEGIRKNDLRLVLFLATILFYPVIFAKILPAIDELWLTRNVSNTIEQKYKINYPLYVVGFNEPSLVFYFNTDKIVYNAQSRLEELNAGNFVLIDSRYLNLLNNKNFTILEQFEGMNYSKGKWTKLILAKKS